MALFANEAQFFRFRVIFQACSLLNEVGDPPFFFYISDMSKSSTVSGKSLRKKLMLENFPAKVLKSSAPFLLSERRDSYFLFHNFNENNILSNWEKY